MACRWRQVADPAVRTNGVLVVLPFGKQFSTMVHDENNVSFNNSSRSSIEAFQEGD
jgi:hypothetical protein